jgi:hypothetical protein
MRGGGDGEMGRWGDGEMGRNFNSTLNTPHFLKHFTLPHGIDLKSKRY